MSQGHTYSPGFKNRKEEEMWKTKKKEGRPTDRYELVIPEKTCTHINGFRLSVPYTVLNYLL